MKRCLLTLLIITCTISLYSQDKIQGTIIDSYDKRPVHGAVIIYGAGKTETTTSNTKGQFWIPEATNQPIQIQRIGYEKTTILPSVLKKQPVIELNLEPVSLAPVEINADAAKHLVEKAIYNTKSKMLTNKYLSYITHITESEHLSGEKRDFFFKYAAIQKKRQPNKKEIPFELRLIDIKHVDSLPDKPVSEILKVGIGRSEFHLHTLSNNFDSRYVTISYTEDNSQIKLESYPSRGSYSTIKNTYYINASDTTLRSVQAESMESRIEKSPYLYNKFMKYKYKLLRMNSSINFEKTDDQYYYASAKYTYIYSFLMGDNEEIIISYLDNKLIDIKDEIGNYKKIDNNARKLYDIPTTIAK